MTAKRPIPGYRSVLPRDLQVGDYVRRWLKTTPVWQARLQAAEHFDCRVIEVRKMQDYGGVRGATRYLIRSELPEGVNPTYNTTNFVVTPQTKLEVRD